MPKPPLGGCNPSPLSSTFGPCLSRERTHMQVLGLLVFGVVTVINLTVLGMFVAGVMRKTRAHR